jgi:hypothetical protein
VFAALILWLITNILWRGYMRKALMLSKAQIENGAAQQGAGHQEDAHDSR